MYRKIQQLLVGLSLALRVCHSIDTVVIKDVTTAEIKSDNYPHPYPQNVDKEWHITHDYGRWLIVIEDMVLEESDQCSKDFLAIIDGEASMQPTKFCGSRKKTQYLTSGALVKLRFHTDDENQRRGFKLTVKRMLDDEEEERKSRQNAAKGSVHYDSSAPWIMPVLVGSVGFAFIVCLGLVMFMLCEIRRKRLEKGSNNMANPVLQWPPRQRSNSKSYGRQASNSSTAPLTHERFMY